MTGAKHEEHVVDTAALYRWSAWLGVSVMVVVAAMYVLWRVVSPPADVRIPEPSGPRLQAHAPIDRATVQARQRALLTSYGWVDGKHQFARIPIDRAMDLMATRPASSNTKGDAR